LTNSTFFAIICVLMHFMCFHIWLQRYEKKTGIDPFSSKIKQKQP
jgi:hypothetical protein